VLVVAKSCPPEGSETEEVAHGAYACGEHVSDESHKGAIQNLQDVLDRDEIPSLAMLRLEAQSVPRLVHHLASCDSVAEANLCCIVPKSALPFLRQHYGSLA
jgi:hypothetical protein